ncbi:MAG: hypothetical protein PHZ04_03270 [Patescibacteria group bacterium]|nr:hypothetical protein [Patescibacteria group bacterium]
MSASEGNESQERGQEDSEEKWRNELRVKRDSLHDEDQKLLRESLPANSETHNAHWKAFNRIITIDTFLEPSNNELSRDELREKVHSEMGTAFINSVFEEEMDEIERIKNVA